MEESVLMTLDLKNTSLLQRESKRRRSDFNWVLWHNISVFSSFWMDPFGPERLVTGLRGMSLNEIDGQPALDLYKNT
jgi:hypothetical protein